MPYKLKMKKLFKKNIVEQEPINRIEVVRFRMGVWLLKLMEREEVLPLWLQSASMLEREMGLVE
jgi:hypothetical protein